MNSSPTTTPRRTRRRPYHPLPESDTPPPQPLASIRHQRQEQANRLVRRFALLGGGAAALPLPVVDVLAVAGVQIRLIRTLAGLYGIPFHQERSRAALMGLLMGAEVGVVSLSIARFLPGLGYLAVAGPGAVLFSALTFAVGKVFIQHFEAGGTLLDFDPARMRAHFQRELALQRRQAKHSPNR